MKWNVRVDSPLMPAVHCGAQGTLMLNHKGEYNDYFPSDYKALLCPRKQFAAAAAAQPPISSVPAAGWLVDIHIGIDSMYGPVTLNPAASQRGSSPIIILIITSLYSEHLINRNDDV